MNPHVKEEGFYYYPGEIYYQGDEWHDTEIWVKVGGLGLLICTLNINLRNSCNLGIRIVDENNTPLFPYRKKENKRHSSHFTYEASSSRENQSPVTFHMIVNCQYAKLQLRPSDAAGGDKYKGFVVFNAATFKGDVVDAVWNHKTISTMSVLPLVPHYQGGANTIFTYPQSRTPRAPDDDKPPVTYPDKINPSSSSGVPPQ